MQPEDAEGAKSRTGYIIRIDDCPVVFASKKQGETALSTTESEYIALSTAMRELIWVRRLAEEIASSTQLGYNRKATIKIKSKVFEDNQGAIAIAAKPGASQRTRHLHTKYHHFKEHLKLDKEGNGIELVYIATKEQIADMFTKGLGHELFVYLRNKLMGWTTKENNENPLNCHDREGVLENTALGSSESNPESRRTDGKEQTSALRCSIVGRGNYVGRKSCTRPPNVTWCVDVCGCGKE